MSRTLLYGNDGMDVVYLADRSNDLFDLQKGEYLVYALPTVNVQDVIDAIKGRIALVGAEVSILVEAQLSPQQCAQVLTAFPGYKRCFQESGKLVMIDK
jgi:hypothetical protein